MKNITTLGLLLGLLPWVLGCGRFQTSEGTAAYIKGTITNIHRADRQGREKSIIGFILIEAVSEKYTKFDKAFISITDKTHIFEQKERDRRLVTFEALEIGQRAKAQFAGPVAQSYPVQAQALEIVILR